MTKNRNTLLTNKHKSVTIHRDQQTVVIGERINPTARKVVLKAFQEGNFEMVRQDAVAQVEAGAIVLDVNANSMAMAIQAGLTCPITNLLVTEIRTAVLAADRSLGKDEFGMRWINAYLQRQRAELRGPHAPIFTGSFLSVQGF